MKRIISIEKTFSELRQLPIEITFQKVEKWVNQHSKYKAKKSLKTRNFFWNKFSKN